MFEANVRDYPIFLRRFPHIGEDGRAVRDGPGLLPRLEVIAERMHVAVRPNARIPEQIPGAADGAAAFQHREGLARTTRLQVDGRANPRNTRANNNHIERFHFLRPILNKVRTILAGQSMTCRAMPLTVLAVIKWR